jgi:hypothetical protein
MNVMIWMAAMFVLGTAVLGLLTAFINACDKV